MTTEELQTTAMAVGGEAVAREDSGRVVFVSGGIPGERVRVAVGEDKATFARGRVVDVLDASPDRVAPPCPHVAAGCGGCDWQHIAEAAQTRLRVDLVREVLGRAGGIVDPAVVAGPPLPAAAARTTVRGTVDEDGRFSFRRRRTNEPVPVDSCLVAHPLIEQLLVEGSFGDADEVTIRVGARTGERLVVLDGATRPVSLPDDVTVATAAELASGRRVWIHEEAAGRRWRISASSFFQATPEGADALVATVAAAVDTHRPDATRLVDLCSGVGLFAGTVGAGRRTVGVERSAAAVADARHNLADLDVRLVKVALARWRPSAADVVVADPARSGLQAAGVKAVAATGAGLCVLVSCDPGSLGRDARLLGEAGYHFAGATTLDLFGHTGQVEVVSSFVRSA